MSTYVKVLSWLFSGSRFLFWTLTPFLTLFVLFMTLSESDWTLTKSILIIVMDAACLFLILGLWNPQRFWWALRGLTAIICGLYFFMIIDELLPRFGEFRFTVNGFIAPLFGAIWILIYVIRPSLAYTFFGRFSFQPEVSEGKESNVNN